MTTILFVKENDVVFFCFSRRREKVRSLHFKFSTDVRSFVTKAPPSPSPVPVCPHIHPSPPPHQYAGVWLNLASVGKNGVLKTMPYLKIMSANLVKTLRSTLMCLRSSRLALTGCSSGGLHIKRVVQEQQSNWPDTSLKNKIQELLLMSLKLGCRSP